MLATIVHRVRLQNLRLLLVVADNICMAECSPRLFRERFLRESWAVSIHALHFRMLSGYEHPAHANQAFNLHREGMQGLQDAVWFRSGLV